MLILLNGNGLYIMQEDELHADTFLLLTFQKYRTCTFSNGSKVFLSIVCTRQDIITESLLELIITPEELERFSNPTMRSLDRSNDDERFTARYLILHHSSHRRLIS